MTPEQRAAARARVDAMQKVGLMYMSGYAQESYMADAALDLPGALDGWDAADAEIARLKADLQHAAKGTHAR